LPSKHHGPLTASCWECEVETDTPIAVSLRTRIRRVSTLALCLSCYRAYCLPLAPDASGTVFVEIEDAGHT
jgi:hypothetical protein